MSVLTFLFAGATLAGDCAPQYQFEIETESTFAMVSPTPDKLLMKGVLTLKPATLHGDEWWAIKADNVILRSRGISATDPRFENPFAFKRAKDGQITEFWFPQSVKREDKDKLKGLAYYFQYAQSAAPMTRVEKDSLGKYRVNYQQADNSLVFQKKAYSLGGKAKGTAFTNATITASNHSVIPTECWFDKREGSESLSFSGNAEEFNFDTQQSYSLIKQNAAHSTALLGLPSDLSSWPDAKQEVLDKNQLAALHIEMLKYLSESDILALDGFHLAEKLRYFDDVIADLPDSFNKLGLNDDAQMRLFNALGQLDSTNSQLALASFLSHSESDENTQFRALRALANGSNELGDSAWLSMQKLIEDPTPLGDLAGSFIMTLGVMLESRERNENTEALEDTLLTLLGGSSEENVKSSVLTALGNSNNDAFVEEVASYSVSDSARLRKSAARALGRFESDEAYQALTFMVEREGSATVQSQVLESLAEFDIDADTRAQVFLFAKDSDNDEVRFSAIKALSEQTYDGKETELRSLLGNETSRRNFTAIVRALHP
ncbi:HEAT repeat domain-containing protein [Grimontia sp. S25]|uniref:HEAT repeat domain-containing protein n=1 Tax=Grimontia sedimenti TaxID=2711294 RepID=A0A6M1RN87_9GAMM|nr:HEAT repeat domain-containing protein [Grimontia sedimenti]NGN99388.1 HEAT repeat domain-containing protein [Grimontia sedimenti]